MGRSRTAVALSWAMACLTLAALAAAQAPVQPAIHHESNFETERAQANQLYMGNRALEALPLYADLCRQDPTVAVFAERHAAGLFAKAATEKDDAAAKHDREQGFAELKRARSLGDTSEYTENMLSLEPSETDAAPTGNAPGAAPPVLGWGYRDTRNPQAKEAMKQAEAAFAANDNTTALADYKRASELDPNYYDAKLYAGDACFRAADYACAGEWFAKAVAVDPNRETAYRYWGDALYKSGHPSAAKGMYERAVVAEPYSRLSWSGLTQWATQTRTAMSSPPIMRPAIVPPSADATGSGTQVKMPPGPAQDAGVWAAYAGCRVDADRTRPPGARRTAEEETHCLQIAAGFAAKQIESGSAQASAYSPGVRSLLALQHDGMIECWVLLNGADQEVLHDYPAYRDTHRQLLIAYLDTFVVHEGQQPATRPPQLQIQK